MPRSYRDLRHASVGEELVEFGDIVTRTAFLAEHEDGALLRARQSDEEGRYSLGISGDMRPPGLVIEANEDDRVIFQSLAFVHGHHRDLVGALKGVETGGPIGGAIGRREEMQAEGLKDDLEKVTDTVFGIGSGDGCQIEIFKDPRREVSGTIPGWSCRLHIGAKRG